jgi:hypothetical protein
MHDDFRTILARASRHIVADALGVASLALLLVLSLHLPAIV